MTMKIIRLTLLGMLLQMFFLAVFVLGARSADAQVVKPLIIGLAIISMIGLFLYAVIMYTIKRLILLSGLLAIAYNFAFYILGLFFFPGFLHDWDGWSITDLRSILVVTATLFTIHLATVLGLVGLRILLFKK